MLTRCHAMLALVAVLGCSAVEPPPADDANDTSGPELSPDVEVPIDDCAAGTCCSTVEGTWYSGCTTGSRDTCTGYYLPCGGGGCYLGADGCFAEPPGYNECCSSPSGGLQAAPQTTVDDVSY